MSGAKKADILAAQVARAAVRALYQELVLFPKPGLVSKVDNGAHQDMNAALFVKSLFALRTYFANITRAGYALCDFATLKHLGLAAEARMLRATGGINTHRGAIFSLGLLAGAYGHARRMNLSIAPPVLCQTVRDIWGDALRAEPADAHSKGSRAAKAYGVRGARGEAAAGYPVLVATAWPAFSKTRAKLACQEHVSIKWIPVNRKNMRQTNMPGHGFNSIKTKCALEHALVQTLFALMAALDDTNLLARGGWDGLAFVKTQAQAFLKDGGVFAPDWRARAIALHQDMMAKHLSPSGAADMLAAVIFLDALCPQAPRA